MTRGRRLVVLRGGPRGPPLGSGRLEPRHATRLETDDPGRAHSPVAGSRNPSEIQEMHPVLLSVEEGPRRNPVGERRERDPRWGLASPCRGRRRRASRGSDGSAIGRDPDRLGPRRHPTADPPGLEPGPTTLEIAVLRVYTTGLRSGRPGSNGPPRGGAPVLCPLSYVREYARLGPALPSSPLLDIRGRRGGRPGSNRRRRGSRPRVLPSTPRPPR